MKSRKSENLNRIFPGWKNKSGYILEKKVYECTDCAGCPFAEKCKRTPHNKKLYVADNFLRFRKQSQI